LIDVVVLAGRRRRVAEVGDVSRAALDLKSILVERVEEDGKFSANNPTTMRKKATRPM